MTPTPGDDDMKTYKLVSVKGNKTFKGTLADAIQAAIKMERRLQPSFGVHVEDASGDTMATIVDGEDVMEC
jgi:hypothetical protein